MSLKFFSIRTNKQIKKNSHSILTTRKVERHRIPYTFNKGAYKNEYPPKITHCILTGNEKYVSLFKQKVNPMNLTNVNVINDNSSLNLDDRTTTKG